MSELAFSWKDIAAVVVDHAAPLDGKPICRLKSLSPWDFKCSGIKRLSAFALR